MIFVLLLLVIIFIVGVILANNSYNYDGLGIAMSVVSGFLLAILLLSFLINRVESTSFVVEQQAVKATVETARFEEISILERATVTKDIIEWNKELSSWQYWNTHWFCGGFINDDVDTLTLIE